MTMELLIETCIRIRFDKNCSLRLKRKETSSIIRMAVFFLYFFLFPRSPRRNTQQKRTILSYRISLRILNELWNIIQQYIFLWSFLRQFFCCYFFRLTLFFLSVVCLDKFIEFSSLPLKLNKCLACCIFIVKQFPSNQK